MSGFLGAIEGVVGGIADDLGGGDFMSELMDVIGGNALQGGNGGGSNGTMGEIGQIASDVLPIVASFL